MRTLKANNQIDLVKVWIMIQISDRKLRYLFHFQENNPLKVPKNLFLNYAK